MLKFDMIAYGCPFCDGGPRGCFPHDGNETWLWTLACENPKCSMQPKTPHVTLRKTSKTDASRINKKILELFNKWNTRPFVDSHSRVKSPKQYMVSIDLSPLFPKKEMTKNGILFTM